MPNPKLTREAAELSGAAAKNPARYAGNVPKNDSPLSQAPKGFNAAQKKVFNEIVENALPGVLTETDGIIVEIATGLLFEYRKNEKENRRTATKLRKWEKELAHYQDVLAKSRDDKSRALALDIIKQHNKFRPEERLYPTSRLGVLKGHLSLLGMSPVDRQRISVPEENENPDDDYEDM